MNIFNLKKNEIYQHIFKKVIQSIFEPTVLINTKFEFCQIIRTETRMFSLFFFE